MDQPGHTVWFVPGPHFSSLLCLSFCFLSLPPLFHPVASLGILSGSQLGILSLSFFPALRPIPFLPVLLSSLPFSPTLSSPLGYPSPWLPFLPILKNGYLFLTPIKKHMLDRCVGTLVTCTTASPPLLLIKVTLVLLTRKVTPLTVLWLPFPNGTFLQSHLTLLLSHGDLSGLGILFWKLTGLTKMPTPPTTPLIPGTTPPNFTITRRKFTHCSQWKLKITKIMSSCTHSTASLSFITPLNPEIK